MVTVGTRPSGDRRRSHHRIVDRVQTLHQINNLRMQSNKHRKQRRGLGGRSGQLDFRRDPGADRGLRDRLVQVPQRWGRMVLEDIAG